MTKGTLKDAENAAREVGAKIGEKMPEGWGFLLVVSSFNDGNGGECTHVSNIQRETMLPLMEEWLQVLRAKTFEGRHLEDECWACGETKGLVRIQGKVRTVLICPACMCSGEQRL